MSDIGSIRERDHWSRVAKEGPYSAVARIDNAGQAYMHEPRTALDALADRTELLEERDRLMKEVQTSLAEWTNEGILRQDAESLCRRKERERQDAVLKMERAEVERDTARLEVEKLRLELEVRRAEVQHLSETRMATNEAAMKAEQERDRLRSLVAECRPVVEAVRAWQDSGDKDGDSILARALRRMKLPAMEGGE